MSLAHRPVTALVRLYRLLLGLYPADQRDRYGTEMVEVFRRVCLRASERRRLGRVAAAELAVLVARGSAARLRAWFGTGGDRGRSDGAGTRRITEGKRRTGGGVMGSETRGWRGTGLRAMVRGLVRRPLHSGAVVATLGLGIAAVAATFAVVDAVLLGPLRGGPIVEVWTWQDALEDASPGLAGPVLEELRTMSDLFTAVEGGTPRRAVLSDGDLPEEVASARVTPGLFRLVGVGPARGPGFTLDSDAGVAPADLAILSHRLWVRRYDGDPAILDRSVEVDGERRRVVGVMPRGFRIPGMGDAELWVPVGPGDGSGPPGVVLAVARLREGLAREAAEAMLSARAPDLVSRGALEAGRRPTLIDPVSVVTPEGTRHVLTLVLGAAALMLLVAVANVLGLGLARAVDRRPEWAVRKALGSGRGRIVAHVAGEGLILGAMGGALAGVLARLGLDWLVPRIPSAFRLAATSRPLTLQSGDVVLGLALGAILGAGVGALTAWIGTAALRPGGLQTRRAGVGRGAGRLRAGLVMGQVAAAFVLLAGAALLLGTLLNFQRVETGYDVDRLLVATLRPPPGAYPSFADRSSFLDRVGEALRGVPDVSSVGEVGTPLPLSKARFRPRMEAEGTPPSDFDGFIPYLEVGEGYFRTAGVRILEGRPLAAGDASLPGAVVSRGLARRLWPGGGAVGRRFRLGDDEPWYTVVGVAENAVHMSLRSAEEEALEYYVHLDEDERALERTFLVRTERVPSSLAGPVRARLRALDPDLPFRRVTPLETEFGDTVARERFFTALVMAFGGLGLVLSAVGLYGILAHTVRARSREIGIRVALGADRGRVLGRVVGRALLVTVGGTTFGVAAALLALPALDALLYGLDASNPVTLVATAGLFLTTAALAAWGPARRALAVDPVEAMRSE